MRFKILKKPISIMGWKDEFSFEKRHNEARKIKKRYPGRVPIICERGDKNMPLLDKKKYLVPTDMTLGQFMYVIRKRITLAPEKAMFLFVNNKLMPNMALMSMIYQDEHKADEFLYITYSGENTFG
jgi:GABA(A) receptor-associated protein